MRSAACVAVATSGSSERLHEPGDNLILRIAAAATRQRPLQDGQERLMMAKERVEGKKQLERWNSLFSPQKTDLKMVEKDE